MRPILVLSLSLKLNNNQLHAKFYPFYCLAQTSVLRIAVVVTDQRRGTMILVNSSTSRNMRLLTLWWMVMRMTTLLRVRVRMVSTPVQIPTEKVSLCD